METIAPRTIVNLILLGLLAACSPPTAEELLADAREALSAGEIGTADVHLRNLLQQDPKNLAARSMLTGVSLALGNFGHTYLARASPSPWQNLRTRLACCSPGQQHARDICYGKRAPHRPQSWIGRFGERSLLGSAALSSGRMIFFVAYV